MKSVGAYVCVFDAHERHLRKRLNYVDRIRVTRLKRKQLSNEIHHVYLDICKRYKQCIIVVIKVKIERYET